MSPDFFIFHLYYWSLFMDKLIFWIVGCSLVFLIGCDTNITNGTQNPEPNTPESSSEVSFVVRVDGLRLRDAEGPNGKVIRTLPYGERLYDLGQVSDFTTQVTLRGITFDEPWLYVRAENGDKGWVYGGALNPDLQADAATFNLLLDKRLNTFFGPELAQAIKEYKNQYEAADTDHKLLLAHIQGLALRDAMTQGLETKIAVNYDTGLPDLFWLEQAFPGFQPALVAEGTIYYLFADYKKWLRQAERTTGRKDDRFAEVAIQFFPEDSIEYFYPAYFIQTWDYGGHSLLGRGLHMSLLSALQNQYEGGQGTIDPLLVEWKQKLVNDITFPENTYWESIISMQQELITILAEDWTILQPDDMITLQARLQQFKAPENHSISTNHGTGMSQ